MAVDRDDDDDDDDRDIVFYKEDKMATRQF